MRRRRLLWAAASALATLLSACITTRPARRQGEQDISGRLALRVDAFGSAPAQSLSAGFVLQGSSQAGRLSLSGPLGILLVLVQWSAEQAVLRTQDDEHTFANLDALTQHLLGQSLPIAALFEWLRGQPWAEAPSTPSSAPSPAGFSQLGWQVDTSRSQAGLLIAERAEPPWMQIRAKISD
jgi:outer membrane lipoprotein LolB